MPTLSADWPDDVDGGVFRRLVEHGFDFSQPHWVDFNVDFDSWPPSESAVAWLKSNYDSVELVAPSDDFNGYAEFRVFGPVTHESVTTVQRRVSSAMSQWGGICESWGVMQDAP
jgi:hypothetical protein